MRSVLLVLAAITSFSAAADTRYVSPAGSNSYAGTSAAPWQTLQYAADMIAPGDTVIVTPGTYAGFNVTKGGLPGQRTVFSAQPGVLIDTTAPPAGSNHLSRITVQNVSHVVIEGFEVVGSNDLNTSRFGILVTGLLKVGHGDIVLRNNNVHHNGISNIFTGLVSNLRIENNVVHRAYTAHGIYVSGGANDHVIRNNVSHSNRGSGIYVNGEGAFGGSGIVANARIENNRIYNNGASGGSAINLDGVQNSVIQSNLLYENHASGISLLQIDGTGRSSGNLIANNTVINAADARWALNIQDGATGNTVLNNILFSLSTLGGSIDIDAASLAGLVSDHNLVEDRFALGDTFADVVQWRARTGDDAGSLTLTLDKLMALFADYAGQDFRLKTGSLAIDRGTASLLNGIDRNAPVFDLVMAMRPAGAGYDIGAFEAQPVPEPATWMMLLAGCALVVWTTARRTRCRR